MFHWASTHNFLSFVTRQVLVQVGLHRVFFMERVKAVGGDLG